MTVHRIGSGTSASASGLPVPLLLPVAPMFEMSMGYPHVSRWVAFYVEPSDQMVRWQDAVDTGEEAVVHTWMKFIQHPVVRPYLDGFNLGTPGYVAEYALLLDRKCRAFFSIARSATQQFFDEEGKKTAEARTTGEDYVEYIYGRLKNTLDGLAATDTADRLIDWYDQHRRTS